MFLRQPSIHASAGVSVGCFLGTGYGLSVGLGRLYHATPQTALVTPSGHPFAHDGAILGGFCGVLIGGSFSTSISLHLGYRQRINFSQRRTSNPYNTASIHLRNVSGIDSNLVNGGRIPLPLHIPQDMCRRITHKGHGI